MKKFNYFFYLCIALTLVISSCSKEGDEVISTETVVTKAVDEPDFVENDGSEEEEAIEELAPSERAQTKTYGSYYDYTLLKPSGLTKPDVEALKCSETKTLPLLVGYYKKKVGTIEISNDDENLYINVKANSYKYMKKVYFYIGDKADIPFYSNGYPKLKAFNYKAFPYYYGGQKKATYKIPLSSIDSDCFEVVAYSKIYDAYSGCYYSSFGYDASLTQKYYYSYYSGCYYFGDWVRSFEFCKESCQEVEIKDSFAYKPEPANIPEKTICFLDEGFSDWGWSQKFIWQKRYDIQQQTGENFKFPLYVDGTTCDPNEATEIGYAELFVYKDGETLKADMKYVVTDSQYQLSELNLYLADQFVFPFDDNNDPTVDTQYYSHKFTLAEKATEYTFKGLDWPTVFNHRAYSIVNAKVCKIN